VTVDSKNQFLNIIYSLVRNRDCMSNCENLLVNKRNDSSKLFLTEKIVQPFLISNIFDHSGDNKDREGVNRNSRKKLGSISVIKLATIEGVLCFE